jgi:hypothetical protein
MRHACGHGQVDRNLRGLPQMEDDGVGRVGGRDKLRWLCRQPIPNSAQMPLNGCCPLGEYRPIERAHR